MNGNMPVKHADIHPKTTIINPSVGDMVVAFSTKITGNNPISPVIIALKKSGIADVSW
jgi:hypothetical protein